MQDANNENSAFRSSEKCHMPSDFPSHQAAAKSIAIPSQAKLVGEQLKLGFECLKVRPVLVFAPFLESIVRDSFQIFLRQFAESEISHAPISIGIWLLAF